MYVVKNCNYQIVGVSYTWCQYWVYLQTQGYTQLLLVTWEIKAMLRFPEVAFQIPTARFIRGVWETLSFFTFYNLCLENHDGIRRLPFKRHSIIDYPRSGSLSWWEAVTLIIVRSTKVGKWSFLKKEGFEDWVSHLKSHFLPLFSFSKTEYQLLQELYNFKKPHKNATEVWCFIVECMKEWLFLFTQWKWVTTTGRSLSKVLNEVVSH